jgi:hypothetical protein
LNLAEKSRSSRKEAQANLILTVIKTPLRFIEQPTQLMHQKSQSFFFVFLSATTLLPTCDVAADNSATSLLGLKGDESIELSERTALLLPFPI